MCSSDLLSLPLGVVETEDASDGLTETDVVGVGEEVTSVSELGNRKFTVLLVEDNIELLNLTREALSVWFKVIHRHKPLLELRRLLFEPFGEAVSYLVNLGVGELYSLAVAHLDVVAMLVLADGLHHVRAGVVQGVF